MKIKFKIETISSYMGGFCCSWCKLNTDVDIMKHVHHHWIMAIIHRNLSLAMIDLLIYTYHSLHPPQQEHHQLL